MRFEVKRKTTVDRDRSQLSIKKRTTKKGGDGEEQISLAWVCSSSGVQRENSAKWTGSGGGHDILA